MSEIQTIRDRAAVPPRETGWAAAPPGGESPSKWLLRDMPPEVAESFSVAQISAIDAAMHKRENRRQPVDLRLSVPFLHWRFFIVLLLGPERRSPKRRAQDRLKHAVLTLFNVLTLVFLLLFTAPAAIGLVYLISRAMTGG